MAERFLGALSEEEIAEFHAAGRQRAYGARVTIVHEGDDAGPVVVLLDGRAKVSTVGAGDGRRSSRSAGPET